MAQAHVKQGIRRVAVQNHKVPGKQLLQFLAGEIPKHLSGSRYNLALQFHRIGEGVRNAHCGQQTCPEAVVGIQFLHLLPIPGVQRIGRTLAVENLHALSRSAEHAGGGHGVQEGLDLPEHILVAFLPDDAVAVEVIQVNGNARKIQRQATNQLKPGKPAGLGEQRVGEILQLRIHQGILRNHGPVQHGNHVQIPQIMGRRAFLIAGQMDPVHRALTAGQCVENGMPVPAFRRVNKGNRAHQTHLGVGGNLPHCAGNRPRRAEHSLPCHIQPDLAVRMGLAGLQDTCQEFFPGQFLTGQLAVTLHMFRAEAAAPNQRIVIVEAEIVLHPQNGGFQLRVPGIQFANVRLPVFAQRTYAQRSGIALDVHHRTEGLIRAEGLAQVSVHHAVPLIDGHGDALGPQQVPDFSHHGQIPVLFFKTHMTGVDLLHIGEDRDIVHYGIIHIAHQRVDLLAIIKPGIAAEPENILKGIGSHRDLSFCQISLW